MKLVYTSITKMTYCKFLTRPEMIQNVFLLCYFYILLCNLYIFYLHLLFISTFSFVHTNSSFYFFRLEHHPSLRNRSFYKQPPPHSRKGGHTPNTNSIGFVHLSSCRTGKKSSFVSVGFLT